MSQNTAIPWTHHTFNPHWGCTEVSEGCANCYARVWAKKCGWNVWGATAERRTFEAAHWDEPLRWNRAAQAAHTVRLVFGGSMCDVFEDHPTANAGREKLWSLIRKTPHLIWQLLTKRPENFGRMLPADWGDGYRNVWLGASIESNEYAERVDILRTIPAALRFVSCEPALGPLNEVSLTGISWCIYGGESGPGFRPHNIQWARDLRERCQVAGIPFFYKQSPGVRQGMDPHLDGRIVQEFPAALAQRRDELNAKDGGTDATPPGAALSEGRR